MRMLFGPSYRLIARLPIYLPAFEFVDQGSRESKQRAIPHVTKHGSMLRFLRVVLLMGVQVHPMELGEGREAAILTTAILAVVRFVWAIERTHVRYPRAIETEGYLVPLYFTVFVRRTSQQII